MDGSDNSNSPYNSDESDPTILALLAIRKRILFPGVLLRLTIGRPKSVKLVQNFWDQKNRTFKKNSLIFISTVPDGENEKEDNGILGNLLESTVIPDNSNDSDSFYNVGTVAKILQLSKVNNNNDSKSYQFSMLVEGLTRAKFEEFVQIEPFCVARISYFDKVFNGSKFNVAISENNEMNNLSQDEETKVRALARNIKQTAVELLNFQKGTKTLNPGHPNANSSATGSHGANGEEILSRFEKSDPIKLVDMLCSLIEATVAEKQTVLAETDVPRRLEIALELINRQVEVLKLSDKIHTQVQDKLKNSQREFFLRQQLKAINDELNSLNKSSNGQSGEKDEMEELAENLAKAKLPTEVQVVADRDMARLKQMQPSQPEYSVLRTYLETLAELPWAASTEDNLDVETARQQLDNDHFGLEKVKKRIIEFLAVRTLRARYVQDIRDELSKKAEPAKEAISVKEKDDVVIEQAEIENEMKELKEVREIKTKIEEKGKSIREREEEMRQLENSSAGPILCLVGPPGVGKTSLGRSIATALNRNFGRLSLGGVRDEAEIRGHRRTYIGAMPGSIIQQMKKVKSNNPVILLDEVDKLGRDSRQGDPAAALLEVLDPEQNTTFTDHYLNVPFDLSKTLFIATANSLETIPAPLLDRMELIEIPSYTSPEKLQIAMKHLIPKQMKKHVLDDGQIEITHDAVDEILNHYTREAGVRNLEREIAALCRYVAVKISREAKGVSMKKVVIDKGLVEDILGPIKFENEVAQRIVMPGVSTGLAWTRVGGDIMFIECSANLGSGRFILTGQLGSVMEESVKAAWSFIKANVELLGLVQLYTNASRMKNLKTKLLHPTSDTMNDKIEVLNLLNRMDLHLHFPAGAVQKDGPSAGVAIVAAILSALSWRKIRADTACTGEITLRGLVLPVGGIKEKVIAAHRAGIKRVVLPFRNKRDIVDIPKEVQDELEIHYAKFIIEALAQLFESDLESDLAALNSDNIPSWLNGKPQSKKWRDNNDDEVSGVIPSGNPQNPTLKDKEKDSGEEMDLCGPVLMSNL